MTISVPVQFLNREAEKDAKSSIVEDEQYIAQGLSMLIDWESCGYEIAGTVYNGQDAI